MTHAQAVYTRPSIESGLESRLSLNLPENLCNKLFSLLIAHGQVVVCTNHHYENNHLLALVYYIEALVGPCVVHRPDK